MGSKEQCRKMSVFLNAQLTGLFTGHLEFLAAITHTVAGADCGSYVTAKLGLHRYHKNILD